MINRGMSDNRIRVIVANLPIEMVTTTNLGKITGTITKVRVDDIVWVYQGKQYEFKELIKKILGEG